MIIKRSILEPIRKELNKFEIKWRQDDQGFILIWESGRKLREKNPELAEKCDNRALPMLNWQGGSNKKLKMKHKFGTLHYLAQWQGIRGKDLDIDTKKEYNMTCTTFGNNVTFTYDAKKYVASKAKQEKEEKIKK